MIRMWPFKLYRGENNITINTQQNNNYSIYYNFRY